jgi:hypothetical protein
MTALSRLQVLVATGGLAGAARLHVIAQRMSLRGCRVDRRWLKRILFAASGTG